MRAFRTVTVCHRLKIDLYVVFLCVCVKCRRLPTRSLHLSLNAHQAASMRLHAAERGEGADRGRDKERESE